MKSLKTLRAKDNNSSDNICIGKITITKEFVKKIMVLLVEELNNCNVRTYDFISTLEKYELYNYLCQFIPAKRYELIDILYFKEWDNISFNDKCEKIFDTVEPEPVRF